MFKKSLACTVVTFLLVLLTVPAHADFTLQQGLAGSLVKELGPPVPNKNGPVRIINR